MRLEERKQLGRMHEMKLESGQDLVFLSHWMFLCHWKNLSPLSCLLFSPLFLFATSSKSELRCEQNSEDEEILVHILALSLTSCVLLWTNY